MQNQIFGETVVLDDLNTLRNLREIPTTKTVIDAFKRAINDLTIRDKGDAQLSETTRVQDTRPFMVKEQEYLVPQKSVFNRITGDSHFELEFAAFLENCPDVISYAKNYLRRIHFKLDYINADGDISNYYPDFLVKLTDGRVIVVETKGREDLDVPLKMQRLSQWCEDVNRNHDQMLITILSMWIKRVLMCIDRKHSSNCLIALRNTRPEMHLWGRSDLPIATGV